MELVNVGREELLRVHAEVVVHVLEVVGVELDELLGALLPLGPVVDDARETVGAARVVVGVKVWEVSMPQPCPCSL